MQIITYIHCLKSDILMSTMGLLCIRDVIIIILNSINRTASHVRNTEFMLIIPLGGGVGCGVLMNMCGVCGWTGECVYVLKYYFMFLSSYSIHYFFAFVIITYILFTYNLLYTLNRFSISISMYVQGLPRFFFHE